MCIEKKIIIGAVVIMLMMILSGCVTNKVEILDQDNPHTGGSVMVYVCGNNHYAQSFHPVADELTRVELYCQKNVLPPNNLTVSIRDDLLGSDLAVVEISPESFPPTGWIEFDFMPNITLNPDATYYIVSRTIGGAIPNTYGWVYEYIPPNTYPNGSFFESTDGGVTWVEYPDNDFCFRTYGLVPE